MKNLMLMLAFLLANVITLSAQNPVTWTTTTLKVSETEFDVVFTASIQKPWCVYSQYLSSNDGPVPTSIAFDKNNAIELLEKAKEDGHKKEAFDEAFGMKLVKFVDEMRIVQRVKGKSGQIAKGILTFMTCDGSMCLPPKDVPFSITLK